MIRAGTLSRLRDVKSQTHQEIGTEMGRPWLRDCGQTASRSRRPPRARRKGRCGLAPCQSAFPNGSRMQRGGNAAHAMGRKVHTEGKIKLATCGKGRGAYDSLCGGSETWVCSFLYSYFGQKVSQFVSDKTQGNRANVFS